MFAILHLVVQKPSRMPDRGKAVPFLRSKNRNKPDHSWISLTFYLLPIITFKKTKQNYILWALLGLDSASPDGVFRKGQIGTKAIPWW